MASGSLLNAEECIDRQARLYLFRGREIESVTGRVLLHAVDGAGRPLCGRGGEDLTPTARPWEASYLPHLPRCPGCANLSGLSAQDTVRPATASGVEIRTAHGTRAEKEARAALSAVLAEHDLRRWMFTDLVTIDETLPAGGLSHPLTLKSATLLLSPARALSVFLHEQLHWMEGPGTEAAAEEASRRCSIRATPGSTARSSTTPAGLPVSSPATGSRYRNILRCPVATSANSPPGS